MHIEKNETMGWVARILFALCLLALFTVEDKIAAEHIRQQKAQSTQAVSESTVQSIEKTQDTTDDTTSAQYKEDKCEVVFNNEQSVIVDYLYSWSTVDREKNINNVSTSYSRWNASTEMIRYANTEAIVKEAIQNALGRTVTKDSSFSEIEHNVTEEVNKVTSLIGVSVDSVKVQGMQFRSQTRINK